MVEELKVLTLTNWCVHSSIINRSHRQYYPQRHSCCVTNTVESLIRHALSNWLSSNHSVVAILAVSVYVRISLAFLCCEFSGSEPFAQAELDLGHINDVPTLTELIIVINPRVTLLKGSGQFPRQCGVLQPHPHQISRRAVFRLIFEGFSGVENTVIVDEEQVSRLCAYGQLVFSGNLLDKIECFTLLRGQRGKTLRTADPVKSEEGFPREVEDHLLSVIVKKRSGAALKEPATAVERPDRLGEELDQVRTSGGDLVVDRPRGGKNISPSSGGTFSSLQSENVAECVCVESLVWESQRMDVSRRTRKWFTYRSSRRVARWPVLLRRLGAFCVTNMHLLTNLLAVCRE